MDWVFRSFPLESIRFFRRVIIFGFVLGFAMSAMTLYLLFETWEQHGSLCDSLLRFWLLVRLFVFVVQLPLRGSIYNTLGNASQASTREEAVQMLLWLCRSSVWKVNQIFGIFLYAWFGFAFLFVYAAYGTTTSFTLSALVIFNIACFFLHMALSFFWFRSLLNRHDFEAAMWKRGVPSDVINKYTTIEYYNPDSKSSPSYNTSCPICFEDYQSLCRVRVLRCNHHYHPRCIDPWLKYKNVCPLCQRKIDSIKPIKMIKAN
ncbi:hypothetical protein AAMO2058_000684900 [Amorphochlora amoebiformis]